MNAHTTTDIIEITEFPMADGHECGNPQDCEVCRAVRRIEQIKRYGLNKRVYENAAPFIEDAVRKIMTRSPVGEAGQL